MTPTYEYEHTGIGKESILALDMLLGPQNLLDIAHSLSLVAYHSPY